MLDRALPTYVTALRMPVTVAVCPWRLKRNGNRLSSIVLTLVKQVVLNSNTANVIPRLSLPQNSHRSKPAPHTPKKRHAVDASFRKRRTFTALPMYTPLRFTSGSSIVSETEKAVSRLNFSCRKDGTHVMMPSFKRPWIHAARQTGASVSTSCCVLFFSGNPGMLKDGIHTTQLSQSNHAALIEFVKNNGYDWVFVGPEVPLIEGIVDDFAAAGIKAFGPSKAAAQIEGSKDFAKQLMDRHNIPTAQYKTFSDLEMAQDYVHEHGAPIVIKADGLAAGKGVTVAMDEHTAQRALEDIFIDHRFGSAGAKVVIEDFLDGQEFSLMSFVNGTDFWPMPISQDHKRAHDGDEGPNTGGMGAYSPVPQIPQSAVDEAIEKIVRPTVEGMAEEGTPFTGILYAGLIATADGPKVIEFNARFGDPETEVVLPKLTSDLGAGISAILDGETPEFTWDESNATLGVVIASNGYPENVIKGARVPEIEVDEDSHVYYAGVASDEHGNLVANSGRVLLVETSAPDIKSAQDKVYAIIDKLELRGLFYRHDIGFKALK